MDLASDLGKLGADRSMFRKLGRSKIGTTRTEFMAKDIVFQNILRGVDEEAKQKGKKDQDRETVKSLMAVQEHLMERNMRKLRSKKDSIIT